MIRDTPRLSVRTIGRREWMVTVRKRLIAERIQNKFRRQGLRCGRIEAEGPGFVFTVDGTDVGSHQSGENVDVG